MWRGILPGATAIASEHMLQLASSGLRSSRDFAASSNFVRALTSTKTSRLKRCATMSQSGMRQRRLFAEMPSPKAA
jgi:hypothetical protein